MPDAGRVIAGSAKGIRLAAPGPGTRPFADRVKQTLFAILEPDLADSAVLDLFAGSGAGGIEALSRGAARATFVERDAEARRVIDDNLRRTGLSERSRVVGGDVLTAIGPGGAVRGDAPYDVVLVDPPYAETDLLAVTLESLGELVRPGGRVVAKHFWRDAPRAQVGLLASERERRFGETALTFYRRQEER